MKLQYSRKFILMRLKILEEDKNEIHILKLAARQKNRQSTYLPLFPDPPLVAFFSTKNYATGVMTTNISGIMFFLQLNISYFKWFLHFNK